MWTTKTFKTREKMLAWVEANDSQYQWNEIFVNNAYGVEFRKLRVVY